MYFVFYSEEKGAALHFFYYLVHWWSNFFWPSVGLEKLCSWLVVGTLESIYTGSSLWKALKCRNKLHLRVICGCKNCNEIFVSRRTRISRASRDFPRSRKFADNVNSSIFHLHYAIFHRPFDGDDSVWKRECNLCRKSCTCTACPFPVSMTMITHPVWRYFRFRNIPRTIRKIHPFL